jgi:hypothetical protein
MADETKKPAPKKDKPEAAAGKKAAPRESLSHGETCQEAGRTRACRGSRA